jgi:hypothetical protein
MGLSDQGHAPAVLYRLGNDPQYAWTGDWVGPRASLVIEARGKNILSLQGIEPRYPGYTD